MPWSRRTCAARAGYGRTFLKLDNGALREDAVRDIGSLLVWIGLQPRPRCARAWWSMGGSYGGYMALASMVNYGDRLAGGVDVVGISNFVTFLQNTSAYRRDLRRAEYGDERDPRHARVPAAHLAADQRAMIRKPLLVVQGLNDPRVPATESSRWWRSCATTAARSGTSPRRTKAMASAGRATATTTWRRWRASWHA